MKYLLFALFFFIFIKPNAQNIYDKYHSEKYFEHLIKSKQYEEAYAEYQRIKFFKWQNDTINSKFLFLLKVKNQNAELKKSHSQFQFESPQSTLLLKEYFTLNPYQAKSEFLIDSLEKTKNISDTLRNELKFKLLILSFKWDEASDYMTGNPLINKNLKAEGIKIMQSQKKFKAKSPFVAGSLSTILPGSGKIYTNEWKDGIMAFLFVASSGFATYRSYVNNGLDSPWTAFLGSFCIGFYSGNIYGSIQSAKRINKLNQKRLNEATLDFIYSK